MNPAAGNWKELGIVSDEASGMAALVCIMEGPRALPGVQLGHLIGPEKVFSPFLHPKVTWLEGKGKVSSDEGGISIPHSLKQQIADLLKPHLVEAHDKGVSDLLSFELQEVDHGGAVESALGCLKCS